MEERLTLVHGFRGSRSWSAGSEEEAFWLESMTEASCSVHGSWVGRRKKRQREEKNPSGLLLSIRSHHPEVHSTLTGLIWWINTLMKSECCLWFKSLPKGLPLNLDALGSLLSPWDTEHSRFNYSSSLILLLSSSTWTIWLLLPSPFVFSTISSKAFHLPYLTQVCYFFFTISLIPLHL